MKVIIAGPRDFWPRYKTIEMAIKIFEKKFGKINEIVSGDADGVDTQAINYAAMKAIDCTIMPANWRKYNKSAGPLRNKKMANYADGLIVIRNRETSGTRNMIVEAEIKELKIYIHESTR